jgi:hypothetical protein
MGVWHLSGLGLNPGAITVPLSYIYLCLKQASCGDERAREFFRTSGELGEKLPGKPEALIIFTSISVIKGETQGEIIDNWFHTKKGKNAQETIKSYLQKLLEELKLERFYGNTWLKYFYLIEVDHQDFDDCFKKIAITLNALMDKEIWINMIGGTNQINAALLSSSGFTSTASVYYYLFQSNIKLLHPEIEKPDFKNLRIALPPPSWHWLPYFSLDMSSLYNKLKELFEYKETLNISEIKRLLTELNFPTQFLSKLRGSFLQIYGEKVKKGPMLEYWGKIWQDLKTEFNEINEFSKWEKWAKEKNILTEVSPV